MSSTTTLLAEPLPADEYLTAQEVIQLRADILAHIEALNSRTRDAVRGLVEVRAIDADALDMAANEISRESSLRMADRDRRTLTLLQNQLNRLERGELGVCEECGAEIAFRRLTAQPTAVRCIDCATEYEQQRRAY